MSPDFEHQISPVVIRLCTLDMGNASDDVTRAILHEIFHTPVLHMQIVSNATPDEHMVTPVLVLPERGSCLWAWFEEHWDALGRADETICRDNFPVVPHAEAGEPARCVPLALAWRVCLHGIDLEEQATADAEDPPSERPRAARSIMVVCESTGERLDACAVLERGGTCR